MKSRFRSLFVVMTVFFVFCFAGSVMAANNDGWRQEKSGIKRTKAGNLVYKIGINAQSKNHKKEITLKFNVGNATKNGSRKAVFTSSNRRVAKITSSKKLRASDSVCSVRMTVASYGTSKITGKVGNKKYSFTVIVVPSTYAKIISVDTYDSKSVRISWKKVSGTTGYLVARAARVNGKLGKLKIIKKVNSAKQLSCVVSAKQNVDYGYCVIPKIRFSNADYYNLVKKESAMSFYRLNDKDAKITSLSPDIEKVTIKWKINRGVKCYKIYTRTNKNESWKLKYTENDSSVGKKTLEATGGKTNSYKIVYVFPKYTISSKGLACYVRKNEASKNTVHFELQSLYGGQYLGAAYVSKDEVFYYNKGNTLHAVNLDINEKTLIDYTLSATGKIKAKKKISLGDYDRWGGFYRGTDGCFYVAVGFINFEKSTTKTVIKVMKYSSSWKLQGVCNIKGGEGNVFEGIKEPFEAGNCQMKIINGGLYLVTSRIMFSDHQSNISFIIDPKTMKYKMANEDYTSHSFNQYVDSDDNNVYLTNHGDAFPRAVRLTVVKNYGKPNQEIKSLTTFDIRGEVGSNYTGLTEGGMKTTTNSIIIAGTSTPQDYSIEGVSGSGYRYAHNVFVTITDKNTLKTEIKWLTAYNPLTTNVEISEVRVVKLSSDHVAILYTTRVEGREDIVHYVVLNDKGSIVSEREYNSVEFTASSQPILYSGGITWLDRNNLAGYVNDGKSYLYWIPALTK